MEPTKEWLALYEKVKEKTKSAVDFNKYFEEKEIAGMALDVMNIGLCDLPSGKVIVADPLVYLDKNCTPYLVQAPAGSYQTEVCVVKQHDGDCARYAAVRLRFNQNRAVKFYEALIGSEDLENFEEGEYFGFNVDAGLGCICDAGINKIIAEWQEKWEKKNPDGEIYNDYFCGFLKKVTNKIRSISVMAETGLTGRFPVRIITFRFFNLALATAHTRFTGDLMKTARFAS